MLQFITLLSSCYSLKVVKIIWVLSALDTEEDDNRLNMDLFGVNDVAHCFTPYPQTKAVL